MKFSEYIYCIYMFGNRLATKPFLNQTFWCSGRQVTIPHREVGGRLYHLTIPHREVGGGLYHLIIPPREVGGGLYHLIIPPKW